jgi:hypothetical protein
MVFFVTFVIFVDVVRTGFPIVAPRFLDQGLHNVHEKHKSHKGLNQASTSMVNHGPPVS